MNLLNKITPFLKEVKLEMKKVNWPTKDQTVKYTLIVVGASTAVAALLGGLDYLFSNIIKKIL